MLLPSRFPLDGTGKRRRPQRIGYQCKDTDFLPVGDKGCTGTAYVFLLIRVIDKAYSQHSSAYTANPTINALGMLDWRVFVWLHLTEISVGWTIVFCPKFFKDLKYLNEILARPSVAEGDLGGRDLVSYEQVILHEVRISSIYYICFSNNNRTNQFQKQWLHNDIMGFSEHREL